METRQVILQLRTAKGLSQEELAAKVYVTRQAVSRWETGETLPNIETLKRLSDLFDVSLHALLGAPRQWICQCCGMPLEESILSQEPDGTPNVAYCQWCYTGGKFVYETQEALIRLPVPPPGPSPVAAGAGPGPPGPAAAPAGPLAGQRRGIGAFAAKPGNPARRTRYDAPGLLMTRPEWSHPQKWWRSGRSPPLSRRHSGLPAGWPAAGSATGR